LPRDSSSLVTGSAAAVSSTGNDTSLAITCCSAPPVADALGGRPLDNSVLVVYRCTDMPSERRECVEVLQGTLDLILLRALSTMGPQHAYGLAARLEQVSSDPFPLNQGTLYAALIRLEQRGWIKGAWKKTDTNRSAKYYAITGSGARALTRQTARWRRLAGLVERLLVMEP
jgi:transcriptional regulator